MSNIGTTTIITKAREIVRKLRPYSLAIFISIVTIIYGTVLFRVETLSNQTPTEDAIASQVEAARTPRIDAKIVEQLNSLEDNSVSVKALFDEARSNPFGQ